MATTVVYADNKKKRVKIERPSLILSTLNIFSTGKKHFLKHVTGFCQVAVGPLLSSNVLRLVLLREKIIKTRYEYINLSMPVEVTSATTTAHQRCVGGSG